MADSFFKISFLLQQLQLYSNSSHFYSNASAKMVSVGQYFNFTSPYAILSFVKKQWHVIFLLEPLRFSQNSLHSDYLHTVMSHKLCILVTLLSKVFEASYH